MMEDETYTYKPKGQNAAIVSILAFMILWFAIDMLRGADWGITGFVVGFMVFYLIARGVWYSKVITSTTLRADALRLDKKEIPYRDLVSVTMLEYKSYYLPQRREYGTLLVIDKTNSIRVLYIEDPRRFVEHLAACMENAGVKIQKKTSWGKGQIRGVINLDRQRRH